ncbi:MAG: hypothetical protein IIA70_02265, partial [Proteobacteria bacterium]|nr:hypothetical protein [Pseudomonadota bacterium]
MWSRRSLLKSAGAVSLTLGFLPWLSFSATTGVRRFVFVILRGAMDGLAAVPPLGDPGYRKTRGSIALGRSDTLELDGFFAIHKSLRFLHGAFKDGELSIFHAIATPYRERSHFDGQDILENGGIRALGLKTGWLGRALDSEA